MRHLRLPGLIIAAALALLQPARVEAQDPYKENIQKLIETTRQRAQLLTERHAAIRVALERANKSEGEVAKVLQETLDYANNAVTIYGENDDIWKLHGQTAQVVDDNVKNAQEKSKTDVRWLEYVKDWQNRRDTLQQVRVDLLKQRGMAEASLKRVVADRDFVLERMKLAGVDAAIEELKKATQEMTALGEGLQSITASLQRAAGSPN